ncbi:MAG: hypothetical protein LBJ36_09190 [Synergistaceae bacterium]|nr:hypothetical protein [Synergistaceae bacterium]
MKKISKKGAWFQLAGAVLVGFFLCARAWGSEDFAYDIRSMIQLNPDFSTYPDFDGVVWLKRIIYEIAPEGGIERKSQWILLGRDGLAPQWLTWNVLVPKGGEAEILEASVYSPGDAEKIMDVREIPQDGGTMRSVVFSQLPDEFILVVSYRELFPERLSVDDLVWVSESLPVWEAEIQVTAPAGHPFYYNSNLDSAPEAHNVDDRMLYQWRVINAAADARFSLKNSQRSFVAFGTREGREAAARSIKGLEPTILPTPPKALENALQGRAKGHLADNVLEWLYPQPGPLLWEGLAREIPAEGPWTRWEKLLLAYRWLRDAGANVHLFWELPYRPGTNEPVCETMAIGPVLEIAEGPKGAVFYYNMDDVPRLGESSMSLRGKMLYGVTPDGKLEERRVSDSAAAMNRLSANFDLSLSEKGIMTGTLKLKAHNGWRRFLFPNGFTEDGFTAVMETLFPQIPRYQRLQFSEASNEGEILVTLAETQVITGTGGRHILAYLPALVPGWIKNLNSGPFPYTLRFPFMLDARFTLDLPDEMENVMLPTPAERNMGKVKYTESYKLNKKKVLTAEAHLTVGTPVIADDNAVGLTAALQGWQAFMARPLPVQLKEKK